MKIGIIGSGDVGQTLAVGFVNHNDQVMIGTRDIKKLESFHNQNPNIVVGSLTDTVKFGEIIILATLWSGTKNAIETAGIENFTGKIVIDVTNPLSFTSDGPELELGFNTSGGEVIQSLIPTAHVIKAFNIVGHGLMIKPVLAEGQPDMFICGNNEDAKYKVGQLINDFGWNSIDMGNIKESRLLEPLALIWIKFGFKYNKWNQAFKLLQN